MSPDRCPTGVLQPYYGRLAVGRLPDAKGSPVPSWMVAPVLLFDPACALGRMFPACPLPKTGEHGAIYFAEGVTTGRVPVIVGPTAYLAVEDKNQIGCCFGQPRSYGFSDGLVWTGTNSGLE
jgi:hypothetical protein